jgi:hypothetical protein
VVTSEIPKLAPSLARSAEPPVGDHRATDVGMGQIRVAAEAFSAARMHIVPQRRFWLMAGAI